MNTEAHIELLGERDVAKIYGFSSAWLRKRRRLRLPPAYIRVGRMVKYRLADLQQFVAAHIVMPNGHGENGPEGK